MVAPATDSPIVGVVLDGAGWHPDAQGAPADPAWWEEQVRAAAAFADLVVLADAFDAPQPRLDAVMLAARLAPRVPGVGLVPQVATTTTEPFRVSTMLATLDHVSAGRAGWLVAVPPDDAARAYVGPREAGDVWAEAAAHVDAVRALWDSWEDDAEIRDLATHRFVDPAKLHDVDVRADRFAIRGPSITPRPPQGQLPVLCDLAPDAPPGAPPSSALPPSPDPEGDPAPGTPADRPSAAAAGAGAGADLPASDLRVPAVHPARGLALAHADVILLGPDDDPDPLREQAGRPVVLLEQLAVAFTDGLDLAAPAPATLFAGPPEQLAEHLRATRADGVLLHLGTVAADLERLGLLPPPRQGDTLRERLGLAGRAVNRYAGA